MVFYFLNFADRNSNRIGSTIEQRRVKINLVLIDVRANENRAKLIVEGAAAVGEAQRIGEIASRRYILTREEGQRVRNASTSPLKSTAQSIK